MGNRVCPFTSLVKEDPLRDVLRPSRYFRRVRPSVPALHIRVFLVLRVLPMDTLFAKVSGHGLGRGHGKMGGSWVGGRGVR